MIEKRDYFQLLLHFLLIVVLSLIQIIYPIFVSEILTVQSTVNSIFVIGTTSRKRTHKIDKF